MRLILHALSLIQTLKEKAAMPRAKTPTTPVKKRAPRKPAVTKLAKAGKQSTKSVTHFVGPEQRAALIAEAAYFRAEMRGFASGHETSDWLAAENDVDSKLMRGAGANSRS
jgi:Protein of unknown function (DUF2934)